MRDRTAKRKTIEEYALAIAADVAQKGLRMKLKVASDYNLYAIPLTIEGDGRICSTVYNDLKNVGILDSFDSTRESSCFTPYRGHYSDRKQPKRWQGVVNKEWFEKSMTMAIAPVFETSGLKRVQDSYSDEEKRKLVLEKDNYISLFEYNSFKDAEFIYLYWNFKDYDVQEFTVQETYSRREKKVLKIYPKALLAELSKGVFYGHASDYLDKHFEWVVKHVLDIPDDHILNKTKFGNMHKPGFLMENWSDFLGTDHVTHELTKIKQMKTMLELAEKSWLRVEVAVDKLGGWDKVKAIARDKFWVYLEQNFPMHLDDKDKDLKKLCEWIMQGKHKGFNEAEQRIANTTTPQEA